jgi:Na+(H+)/acetate symporter ActP
MIIGLRSAFRSLSTVFVAIIVAAALVTALLIAAPGLARANGVPVSVDLAYIDLSNWGPQDATGTAELIFAEGIVRIDADGLPLLQDSLYQAWLVNSEAGDAISAGRFNASAAGHVSYEGTLPPIADFGFDLLILTVEPEPDDAPQPTEQRSIGGYFSLLGVAGLDGQGGEAQGGNLQAPGALPNTGDPAFLTDMIRVGALAMAMGLSVVVGLRLSRRTA